jgi:hypothetical protein
LSYKLLAKKGSCSGDKTISCRLRTRVSECRGFRRHRPQETAQHAHLEFVPHLGHILQANSTVRDPEELVDHRLIGPLRQQRRDGVVPPIEDEQQRRRCRPPKLPQVALRVIHLRDEVLPESSSHGRHAFVPDDRALLEREEERRQAFEVAVEDGSVGREGGGGVAVQGHDALIRNGV